MEVKSMVEIGFACPRNMLANANDIVKRDRAY